MGEWVESGYDGIRAVFHGEPINARCDQSRTLPRLLRAAPQAGIQDIQHNTAQRLACLHLHFFLHVRPSQRSFFFCALYLFLSLNLRANPALSTWDPQRNFDPLLYRRFMHACDLYFPGRLPNRRQTSELEPVPPVTD